MKGCQGRNGRLRATTPLCNRRFAPAATIRAAASASDFTGFCLGCGSTQHGVHPDAAAIECHSCGGFCVYGAEELLWRFGVPDDWGKA
jgi:hypothetical protein